MPLETPAKRTAERILLLTESIREAVMNDNLEDLGGLFQSRQEEINKLETMDIDSGAKALLLRVDQSEAKLMTQLQRTQASATRDLIQMFAGKRNVLAYRSGTSSTGFQRTG